MSYNAAEEIKFGACKKNKLQKNSQETQFSFFDFFQLIFNLIKIAIKKLQSLFYIYEILYSRRVLEKFLELFLRKTIRKGETDAQANVQINMGN